ncbi:uncharacterized protein SOCE836_082960 [Sorangium cellulosum]|uniref:Uncharacterized protein n=1 Tax=Sorangium cellulosum TaxID=56 RepID=A0A4P2QZN4_SORCE|nr:uncharacterized protein SOCE836_082960 [Sorangium cellulosum]
MIRQGHERIPVVAVPADDLARRAVPVAQRRVRVEISALEHLHVERLLEPQAPRRPARGIRGVGGGPGELPPGGEREEGRRADDQESIPASAHPHSDDGEYTGRLGRDHSGAAQSHLRAPLTRAPARPSSVRSFLLESSRQGRASAGWRYVGATHEVLTREGEPPPSDPGPRRPHRPRPLPPRRRGPALTAPPPLSGRRPSRSSPCGGSTRAARRRSPASGTRRADSRNTSRARACCTASSRGGSSSRRCPRSR